MRASFASVANRLTRAISPTNLAAINTPQPRSASDLHDEQRAFALELVDCLWSARGCGARRRMSRRVDGVAWLSQGIGHRCPFPPEASPADKLSAGCRLPREQSRGSSGPGCRSGMAKRPRRTLGPLRLDLVPSEHGGLASDAPACAKRASTVAGAARRATRCLLRTGAMLVGLGLGARRFMPSGSRSDDTT